MRLVPWTRPDSTPETGCLQLPVPFASGTYTAATDVDEGDLAEVELSLAGDDADVFDHERRRRGDIQESLRTSRSPKDANQDNAYKINVVADR